MKTLKIFVVDDNIFYSNLLKSRLSKLSMSRIEVEIYHTAGECLKKVHQRPDIIFLDHRLPDRNGLEVLKEIKSTYPEVQIVMVSGQQQLGVAVESLKYGATDYLIKNEDDSNQKIKQVVLDCMQLSQNLREKNAKTKQSFLQRQINNFLP